MSQPKRPVHPPSHHIERRRAAILSADVKGYSRLMGEDEEVTLRTLTAHRHGMDALIRINPSFSLEEWAQRIPFKDPTVTERYVTALRKAGLK